MSDKQRAEFEKWAKSDGFQIDVDKRGSYKSLCTWGAWKAWQAAIASVVFKVPEMHDGSKPCRCYYDKDDVEQALNEAGIRYE